MTRRAAIPPEVTEDDDLGIADPASRLFARRLASRLIYQMHPAQFQRVPPLLRRYAQTRVDADDANTPIVVLDKPTRTREAALGPDGLNMSTQELEDEYERHGGVFTNRTLSWLIDVELIEVLDAIVRDGPMRALERMQRALDRFGREEITPRHGRNGETIRSHETVAGSLGVASALLKLISEMRNEAEAHRPKSTAGTPLGRWTTIPGSLKNRSKASDKERGLLGVESAILQLELFDSEIAFRFVRRFGVDDFELDLDELRHQPPSFYTDSALFTLLANRALLAVGFSGCGRVGQYQYKVDDLVARMTVARFKTRYDVDVPGVDEAERPFGAVLLPSQKNRLAEHAILTARMRRRLEVLHAFLEGYLRRKLYPDEPLIPSQMKLKGGRLQGYSKTSLSAKFCGGGISRRRDGKLLPPRVALVPLDPDSIGRGGLELVRRDLLALGDTFEERKAKRPPELDPERISGYETQELLAVALRHLPENWQPWRGVGPHGVFRRLPDQMIADFAQSWLQEHDEIPGRVKPEALKEVALGHKKVPGDPLRYTQIDEKAGRERLRCYGALIVEAVLERRLGTRRGPVERAIRETCMLIQGLRSRVGRADQRLREHLRILEEAAAQRVLDESDVLKAVEKRLAKSKHAATDAPTLAREVYDLIVKAVPRAGAAVASAELGLEPAKAEHARLESLLAREHARLEQLCADPSAWKQLEKGERRIDGKALARELLAAPAPSTKPHLVRDWLVKSELCALATKYGIKLSEATLQRNLDPAWKPADPLRIWPASTPAPCLMVDEKTLIAWVPGLNPRLLQREGLREEIEQLLSKWPDLPGWREGGPRRARFPLSLPAGVRRLNDFAQLDTYSDGGLTLPADRRDVIKEALPTRAPSDGGVVVRHYPRRRLERSRRPQRKTPNRA